MCGISGFISKKRITVEELRNMNDTMYHRGPDDNGVMIYEATAGYGVGMAQRRLSIQDLSPLGHQPMDSRDGRLSIVFNGEIYNFLKLREELKGFYDFKSTCDTEVILAAYLKWGIDCVNRFNGMFAIALYDRDEQKVFFLRDRIGKKPFYYEIKDADGDNEIYFASELKPIMVRPGFEGEINTEIISRYLYQQYINAPETIFKNVYKLEPGGVLTFDLKKKGKEQIEVHKYWDIAAAYHENVANPVNDYDEAKLQLKELLKEAVAVRMISDVPLGAFLSGGYDSSLMTAIAQELSSNPVKTFSIGFNEPGYNEAEYAKKVSDYLGTEHTEMYIGEEEMFKLVESIPTYYDEPFADSSQICTMLVSELAKKKVTVALSGDGGDEFFCGYNVYEMVKQAQGLDFLGAMTNFACNLPGFKQMNLMGRLPFKVRVIASNRNPETKTQFGSDNYITRAQSMVLGEHIDCHFPVERKYDVSNWQTRRMLLDMDTYLPGDILCKVDRAAMKYSLESRCPILDKDVMEYSFRLPHEFKYQGGVKKRILKDIAYDYIPRELLDRPKVGFGVPLDKWLRGPLKEQLMDMCSLDVLKKQGIFDAEFTSKMINDYIITGDGGPATGANYSKLTWSFFVFQQWYFKYMNK